MRYFLLLLILLPVGLLLARQSETPDPVEMLEVVTYNIDNIKDERRLHEVYKTIKNMGVPDVLLMQEVHGKSAAAFLAVFLTISRQSCWVGPVIKNEYPGFCQADKLQKKSETFALLAVFIEHAFKVLIFPTGRF